MPLLSILDPDQAVRDMHEYAKMGFKGVQLPPGIKNAAYYDPSYEPIWAAAEDLNMPIAIHSGRAQGSGSRQWFRQLNSADSWPAFFQETNKAL